MTNADFAELWAMADELKKAVAKMDDRMLGRRGASINNLWEFVGLTESAEARLRDWLNDHDPEGGA